MFPTHQVNGHRLDVLVGQRRIAPRVQSGALVVPSCSKADGRFTCLECAGALVLKQGKINAYHFAHHRLSPGCSGGGESALHLAAKLLIGKYCSRLILEGTCATGTHNLERRYTDSSARQEYRYDRHRNYSADVAILQNGVIASIVEVCVSHATTGDALQSRMACVGANNVWEISAIEILNHQAELFTTANAIEVRSLLQHELGECTPVCHRRVREAEELAETARQQEIYRITRPRSDCGVLGVNAVTLRVQDTKTGYLCANCGRKCPSCDDYVSTAKTVCCASCSRTCGPSGKIDGPTCIQARWKNGKSGRFVFSAPYSSGTPSICRGSADVRSVLLGLH